MGSEAEDRKTRMRRKILIAIVALLPATVSCGGIREPPPVACSSYRGEWILALRQTPTETLWHVVGMGRWFDWAGGLELRTGHVITASKLDKGRTIKLSIPDREPVFFREAERCMFLSVNRRVMFAPRDR